jgi:Fe-S-cluster containining protein
MSPAAPDCLTCGACCAPREPWPAYVEVTRLDRERFSTRYRARVIDGELATVPDVGGVRCVALRGAVGGRVACRIHPRRPDACRRFERGSPECHEAREEVLGVTPPGRAR